MAPFRREIRACFDRFVQDLVELVYRAVEEGVAAELERLVPRPRPVWLPRSRMRASAEGQRPQPRRRKARASDAPRRALQQLELPLQVASERPSGEAKRSRRESAEPKPLPLFVHRRARDGQIHHLSRNGTAQPEQPVQDVPGSR